MMPTHPNRQLSLLTGVGIGLVAAVYLLQVFSPLRLNHDAVRLLSMAVNAHETGSYLVDGKVEQYPPGYPYLVKLLLDAGLGSTTWLNLMNLVWLGVGCWGWYWIGRRQAHLPAWLAGLAVLLPLLSWVCIKHAVIPLTDFPYLGISTLALLFAQRYWSTTDRLAWRDLTMALMLSVAAMQVRTIGIALLAAVGAAVLCHPLTVKQVPPRLRPGRRILLATGIPLVLLLLVAALTGWIRPSNSSSYLFSVLTFLKGEAEISPWQVLLWRLTELTSVFANYPLPANRGLVIALPGLIVAAGLLYAARAGWNTFRPCLFYLGFYVGILALWPFTDPRFFLPVLPLISLLFVSTIGRFIAESPARLGLGAAYLGLYAMLGLAALGYSTRLSLSGENFARLYGLPDAQATYAHAFGLSPAPDSPPPHASWLKLLQRFEPRTKTAALPAPDHP